MTIECRLLEDLLSLDIAQLRAQRRTHWKELLESCNGNLLVFGAGELGLKTLQGLLDEGIRPKAVLDNRATSNSPAIMGIPLLTPQQAMSTLGSQPLCLVAVFNTSAVRAQLASLGFTNVAHCLDAFAGLPKRFLPYVCLDDTDIIFQYQTQIRQAYDLMADKASKSAFIAQLRHRLFLNFHTVLAPQSAKMKVSEYFPDDIYRSLDNEVLVDCGAFHGDTIERFIDLRSGEFSFIYGLEPDPLNFIALQNYITGLDEEFSCKIKALPYGVGKRSEVISFQSDGSVRSGSSANGNNSVQIERLDDLYDSNVPTLIKMDIEGAEPDALRGASHLIQEHAPVLAICVYHASSHLWEIPLLMSELNPDYRVFLRAHAEDCWDVTCYAVPQNRCFF